MSSVSELVDAKMKEQPAGKAGNDKKKMIVFITEKDSEILGGLGTVTSTGKIELGSELLRLSIADAHKAAVRANKMTDDGGVVGAKPKPTPGAPAPTPPAPPAAK